MRILITGSAEGLGYAAAAALQDEGHQVVVHVRAPARLTAVQPLVDRGAQSVVGDLSDLQQTREVAQQVNLLGRMDAIIQNAGVYEGRQVLPTNVVAPYVLTCLIARPQRMIFLSSGMHTGGRADVAGQDWLGRKVAGSYSDSKLFVTAISCALARLWPGVISNAVDPGWVPTRMGGPDAPGDLRLGHRTQEWLATSNDPEALVSGGYWHHQRRRQPHPAALDVPFQGRLIDALEQATGLHLPAA